MVTFVVAVAGFVAVVVLALLFGRRGGRPLTVSLSGRSIPPAEPFEAAYELGDPAERELSQMLEAMNAGRRARGLPERTLDEVRRDWGADS